MSDSVMALAKWVEQMGATNSGPDAPGHSHTVPGVWDSDNGRLAGEECAYCTLWRQANDAARDLKRENK